MHEHIIKCMRNLGYKSNIDGVCFGFAVKGLEAQLLDDLSLFENRVQCISKVESDNLVEKIDKVKQKRADLVVATKNKLKGVNNQRFFLGLNNHEIRCKLERDEIDKVISQHLSCEELLLLEIPPFFEGIELYYHAYIYPQLFEENLRPKTQDVLKTIPLASPLAIKDGDIKIICPFDIACEEEQLETYFSKLRKTLKRFKTSTTQGVPHIAFLLNTHNHAISIAYDINEDKWSFIDANNDIPVQYFSTSSDIALKVMKGFSYIETTLTINNNKFPYLLNPYELDKLESNLQYLWQSAISENNNLSITISNFKHNITIKFDIDKKTWIFTDNNNHYSTECISNNDIVNKVANLFMVNKKIIFSTTPYVLTKTYDDKNNIALKQWATQVCSEVSFATINKADNNGSTLLLLAALREDLAKVIELLERGADPNQIGPNGNTPFGSAASKCYLEIMKTLLKYGVNINHARADGATALYFAAQYNQMEILGELLDNKADTSLVLNDGSTPLQIATANGHLNVVKLLLERGAKPNQCNIEGITALYFAAQLGFVNILEELLTHNADVNQAENNGATPLIIASQLGHYAIVELLLNHQAKIDQPMINGGTPLYIAAQEGHLDIVKLLVTKGATINQITLSGSTALFAAAQNGHIEIVNYLLSHGAQPNLSSDSVTPLYVAARNGHLNVIEALLKNGAKVDEPLEDGTTPLSIASLMGHQSCVQLLLKYGANVNLYDEPGVSPLYMAVQNNHPNIVAMLVKQSQIKIDLPLYNGATPLHIAIQNGHFNIVKILIENGADPKKEQSLHIDFLRNLADKNDCKNSMEELIQKKTLKTSPLININAFELALALEHQNIINELLPSKKIRITYADEKLQDNINFGFN